MGLLFHIVVLLRHLGIDLISSESQSEYYLRNSSIDYLTQLTPIQTLRQIS